MVDKSDAPAEGSNQIILDYLDDLLGAPLPVTNQGDPAVSTNTSAITNQASQISPTRVTKALTKTPGSGPPASVQSLPAEPPPWARDPFQCLLFKVAGLGLAVPLVQLGGVHSIDSDVTPLFGTPDWFLGISRKGDASLKVVDTALWLMPEKYCKDWLSSMKFLICLGSSEWAMGCSEILQAVVLDPQQVKWRVHQTKSPWLAGTVISQMCALIHVDGFLAMLE